MQQEKLDTSVGEVQSSFATVTEKLHGWLDGAIALLPNAIVALIVLFVAFFAAKLARNIARRFFARITASPSIAKLLARLVSIVVLVVGLFVALGVLQLDKTVTSLLAGAGVIGLALAFAFQDLAANLISGFYMAFQRPLSQGDLVETNDKFGTVKSIDLRHTVLTTPEGQTVFIPNKEIFEKTLVNFSREGRRRVDLPVGVSYGEDLAKVEKVAHEAISALDMRRAETDVDVLFTGFGASSIDLVVRFWVDFAKQSEYLRAQSIAIQKLKAAFDDNDIMIPFPIRTLDFGIRGGVPLAEAWPQGERTSEDPAAGTDDSQQETPSRESPNGAGHTAGDRNPQL